MNTHNKDVEIGKAMAYALRHDPAAKRDAEGWMTMHDILEFLDNFHTVTQKDVERIINENPKKRFELLNNKIRAVQGHSVKVELNLVAKTPPKYLYHGTKLENAESIRRDGLQKMARNHVHLSHDEHGASIVAQRWHSPFIVFVIDAQKMAENGIIFYQATNGVWLTDTVPSKYILNLPLN